MGKLTIGPKSSLNAPESPIKQTQQEKAQVIPERIIERIEVPVYITKEVEKLVEVEIHHIQRVVPQWARWSTLIAVVEALVIAILLESLH